MTTYSNFLGEHARGPVLAHDKGRSTESNKETKNVKLASRLDQTSHSTRDGSKTENNSHQNSGTILVAKRSIHETHEDGSGNRANVRSPNLLFRKTKCYLDLRKKRGDGEPNEECSEETHPREVEGTHVGSLEGKELDFFGLIILIGIDLNVVSVVFLPFGGFSGGDRHDDLVEYFGF